MKQLSRKEAIHFCNSQGWQSWTDAEIVRLQLFQTCLCVPFRRFHAALEQVLGRGVYTHEFAGGAKALMAEYSNKFGVPTTSDINALLTKGENRK